MPTDLLDRVRRAALKRPGVEERRMVGGRSFVLDGELRCGVTARGLLVRLTGGARTEALTRDFVEPARMGTKEMAAYVLVTAEATATDADLEAWLELAFNAVAR
jgi:hypothetical protein